jgi:histidinol-phosphatase (PHP family)
MAEAAFRLGFVSLGFSGHGPQGFDRAYSIRDFPGYVAEIKALKERYMGRMRIWLGIEQDPYGAPCAYKFDYVIGALHYIRHDGKQCAVDGWIEKFERMFADYFNRDGIALARAYYNEVSLCARLLRPDIMAHFDILRKLNANSRFVSTSSPAYRRAALRALECVKENAKMLEVNTGGMARGYLDSPYPEPFILEAWREMGGRVIITSDCHRADLLNYAIDETATSLRRMGYKSVARLGAGGDVFEDLELSNYP